MATTKKQQQQEDLTHQAFRDDAWLGLNLLTKYNVLEYFSRSPFYVPPDHSFYYLITEEQEPHLYVVQKVASEAQATTGTFRKCLAVFYVLDQTVFQAPTLSSVLQARTARCLHHLKKTFDQALALYDPLAELQTTTKTTDH